MSTGHWKRVLHKLYELGGTATLEQLRTGRGWMSITKRCLDVAVNHGLVVVGSKCEGIKQRPRTSFSLTTKGRLWCQGKIIEGRGIGTARSCKAYGFLATWLLALPERIRLSEVPPYWQQLCIVCCSREVLYYPDQTVTMMCAPCITASFELLPRASAATSHQIAKASSH